jgi:hypothetical protein
VLVLGHQLVIGISSFAQVGPPLIVHTIFSVLLFVFRGNLKA